MSILKNALKNTVISIDIHAKVITTLSNQFVKRIFLLNITTTVYTTKHYDMPYKYARISIMNKLLKYKTRMVSTTNAMSNCTTQYSA